MCCLTALRGASEPPGRSSVAAATSSTLDASPGGIRRLTLRSRSARRGRSCRAAPKIRAGARVNLFGQLEHERSIQLVTPGFVDEADIADIVDAHFPFAPRAYRREKFEHDEHLGARDLPGTDCAHVLERCLEQRVIAGSDQIDVDRAQLDRRTD